MCESALASKDGQTVKKAILSENGKIQEKVIENGVWKNKVFIFQVKKGRCLLLFDCA